MNISHSGYTQCPCCHAHFHANDLLNETPICHSCGNDFTKGCTKSKGMMKKAKKVLGATGVLLSASLLGASLITSCAAPVGEIPTKKDAGASDAGSSQPDQVVAPLYGAPAPTPDGTKTD